HLAPFRLLRPAIRRDRAPPHASALASHDRAGLADLANPMGSGSDPEMPFAADHAGPARVDKAVESFRLERAPGPIDEALDAVFLGLRLVVGEFIQFLEPDRMPLGALEIETA